MSFMRTVIAGVVFETAERSLRQRLFADLVADGIAVFLAVLVGVPATLVPSAAPAFFPGWPHDERDRPA